MCLYKTSLKRSALKLWHSLILEGEGWEPTNITRAFSASHHQSGYSLAFETSEYRKKCLLKEHYRSHRSARNPRNLDSDFKIHLSFLFYFLSPSQMTSMQGSSPPVCPLPNAYCDHSCPQARPTYWKSD